MMDRLIMVVNTLVALRARLALAVRTFTQRIREPMTHGIRGAAFELAGHLAMALIIFVLTAVQPAILAMPPTDCSTPRHDGI